MAPTFNGKYTEAVQAIQLPNGHYAVATSEDGVFEWNGNEWVLLGNSPALDGTGNMSTISIYNDNPSGAGWDLTSSINSIYALPNNDIVADTGNGVYEWDGKKWSLLGSKSNASTVSQILTEFFGGKIIEGTYGSGVFELNKGKWVPLGSTALDGSLPYQNGNHDFSAFITSLAVGGRILYAGTQEGVYAWTHNKWMKLGKMTGAVNFVSSSSSLINGLSAYYAK